MTAYNREKYISDAIESVLASTFDSFELIIVDDCSIDNSVAIAKKYAEKDQRIRVYVNKKNLGDYPNRNRAASYAKGKYLKYVDADDLIYPWGLEILVKEMESYPDAGWGLCSIDQDEGGIFPILLKQKEILNYHFNKNSLFHKASLSSIIKRDIFFELDGFSGKRHLGDYEMWLKLSLFSDVLLLPHGIVWHRTHDEQESVANKNSIYIQLKYDISLLKFLRKRPNLSNTLSTYKLIINDLRRHIVKSQIKMLCNFNFVDLKSTFVELQNDIETFS